MLVTLTDATRIMSACVERGNAGYGTACVAGVHAWHGSRCVRERWSTRGTGWGVTGGSPGTLQLAALPGALATLPFVYPLPYTGLRPPIYRVFALSTSLQPATSDRFSEKPARLSTPYLSSSSSSSLLDCIKSWHLCLSLSRSS